MSDWPLWALAGSLLAAALVIAVAGTRLTATSERLARDTGLGQAVFGAVFLGGSTSLPGITTSIAAAAQGHAALAVSNGVGGIAAQTVFLVVADVSYRKANLEHAAANPANLMQGALLVTLLSLPILAMAAPDVSFWAIHPVSVLLIATYAFGIHLLGKARTDPMWAPSQTPDTVREEDEASGDEAPSPKKSLTASWLRFAGYSAVVGVAGYAVAQTGGALSERTALSESFVGMFLTSVTTSLPELVTSVAAVRRGALTLAVGDVLGGNCFDVLFVAAADFAYRDGAIYRAIAQEELFILALTILLTGVLLLGLLRREKHGIANIGFESFLVVVIYIGAFVLLYTSGTG